MPDVMMVASRQWASRPDDQRFTGATTDEAMANLFAYVDERSRLSDHFTASPRTFVIDYDQPWDESNPTALGDLWINANGARFNFTHWSFGQTASLVKAGADSLRELPAEIVAKALRYRFLARDEALKPAKWLVTADKDSLATSSPFAHIRAATGPTYGYIADLRVVKAVMRMRAANPAWVVPLKAYNGELSKLSTTLYASDRDIFLLLVDETHDIEVGGERLSRFFIVMNSEVGKATFDVLTGLYRWICQNRMIHGATQVQQIKIRHTSRAPERFEREFESDVIPVLTAYANASAGPMAAQIGQAMQTVPVLLDGKRKGERIQNDADAAEFLTQAIPLLSERAAKAAVHLANTEEGDARTVWQLLNGTTAYARAIPHQDKRTELEQAAGALLAKFAS